jgi:predicted metalloprotease
MGLGGLVVVLIVGALFGVNPLYLLGILQDGGDMSPPQTYTPQTYTQSPADGSQADFVRAILGDTEDTWRTLFQRSGQTYADPKLVLFTGTVQSACGFANAAVGPFYCPRNAEVYLDMSFFSRAEPTFRCSRRFCSGLRHCP